MIRRSPGVLDATRERQRRDVTAAMELVAGGEVGEADRDGVWALTSPEVYLLLVESSGWTVDQYEAWMSENVGARRSALVARRRGSSMKTKLDGPADTSMMRIVHSALRRDLHRAETALNGNPPPPPAQQIAIARHLEWMMSFLHAHHRSEDDGLYPLVRDRDPGAVQLVDAMDADHRAVALAIVVVEATARDSAVGTGPLQPLIAAVGSLSNVLLPHLEREENEMMPVVSSVVTDSEWRKLEQQYNLKGKSSAQLGFEGHWLIDDASPEDRQRVVGLVAGHSSIHARPRIRVVLPAPSGRLLGCV